ncbi:MAG: hypothetical protein UT82_C0009G0048 [Parcubacteria group bacterium GW2011_GWB1_40_14]|nr:MAG: hypothetical protein UT82_C0009G0048 [Parcubacteria group bacterium GW2011_GWB1_40_14]
MQRLAENSHGKVNLKITGARVVCSLCAEIRDILIDGTVHIYKKKGDIEVVELPTEYVDRILKKKSFWTEKQ